MATTIRNIAESLADDVIHINTSHLERLYHEVVTLDGLRLGVIDIYLDAPEYTLVFDESEGFTCLDDIARAVVFYCRYYKQNASISHLQKIESLLETIFFLQSENGYFYNFIFPDLSINKNHINSTASPNFWSWRAMWALSEVQLLDNPKLNHIMPSVTNAINRLIENILVLIEGKQDLTDYNGIKIPEFVGNIGADQISVIIASLTNCYRYSPSTQINNLIKILGNALLKTQVGDKSNFPYFAFLSCKNLWHAWGNCQSCALLFSGKVISNNDFIIAAKNEVQYFYPYLIKNNFLNKFDIIRYNDKLVCSNKEQFPQIAYDIRVMVFGAAYAYKITKDIKFANIAAQIAMWLFGHNVANLFIYESKNGRCYDGIDSSLSVNKNSGAESTIEALLILSEIEKFPAIKKKIYELLKIKNHE